MEVEEQTIALRAISYGLYVLTSSSGGVLGAAAVNWLSQVSFQPRLVAMAVGTENENYPLIVASGTFAVNVVGEGQLDIARDFFRGSTLEGSTLNGHPFELSPKAGCPLLVELPYWFEARVVDSLKRGDHRLFVGQVIGGGVRDSEAAPLPLRSTGLDYGG